MHLGLVGGIGPAATDYYYRQLISRFRARGQPLDATIVHADSPTLLANMDAGAVEAQVEIYGVLAGRLLDAGADVMAITSISGHFCVEEFRRESPLPVCNILETISSALSKAGYSRVGVLGTRGTMTTRLFGGITSAEVVAPSGPALDAVHEAYVSVAMAGAPDPVSRETLVDAGREMVRSQDVEAVLLGGTDLIVVMDGAELDFPVVDCAGLHITELARLAGVADIE